MLAKQSDLSARILALSTAIIGWPEGDGRGRPPLWPAPPTHASWARTTGLQGCF